MTRSILGKRRAGVLLHPTSLPGNEGNGRIGGAAAAGFIEFLANAGCSVWQTLPLNPRDSHGSPYASESVFAGDLTLLEGTLPAELGLASPEEARELDADTDALQSLLPRMSQRLAAPRHAETRQAVERYAAEQSAWLEDYALYRQLRTGLDLPWYAWPRALRRRDPDSLAAARRQNRDGMAETRLGQFLFDCQWRRLRAMAARYGILMFGDLSFFVAHDSADVWANQSQFRLDGEGGMSVETGVPPDYFSASGQLWHMPHYDWEAVRRTGYRWWMERMRRQSLLFDMVRIDHFRGLAAAWEVAAGATDAIGGRWRAGPGIELLTQVRRELPQLALAAEDLGLITDDVRELRDRARIPGMRVYQFGFDGDPGNPHLPANCDEDAIYYTGTHDNDTLAGWLAGLDDHTAWLVRQEAQVSENQDIVQSIIGRVLDSRALLTMIPMQDLLGLGNAARMNVPGRAAGNWRWRLEMLPDAEIARNLAASVQRSGRHAATKASE